MINKHQNILDIAAVERRHFMFRLVSGKHVVIPLAWDYISYMLLSHFVTGIQLKTHIILPFLETSYSLYYTLLSAKLLHNGSY